MCIVSDDLRQFANEKSSLLHRLTPELFYSFIHSPSALKMIRELIDTLSGPVHRDNHSFLWYLPHFVEPSNRALYKQTTVAAFKNSPQSDFDCSSGLAAAAALLLKEIAALTETSSTESLLYSTPHRRWLRRTKPAKLVALGSPKLASPFRSRYLKTRRTIGHRAKFTLYVRYNKYNDRLSGIHSKCCLLLRCIVLLLPMAACTTTVARLGQKCLPKAVLMYPKLMRSARTEMDVYVLRWEGA